jgi:hypothetical protein
LQPIWRPSGPFKPLRLGGGTEISKKKNQKQGKQGKAGKLTGIVKRQVATSSNKPATRGKKPATSGKKQPVVAYSSVYFTGHNSEASLLCMLADRGIATYSSTTDIVTWNDTDSYVIQMGDQPINCSTSDLNLMFLADYIEYVSGGLMRIMSMSKIPDGYCQSIDTVVHEYTYTDPRSRTTNPIKYDSVDLLSIIRKYVMPQRTPVLLVQCHDIMKVLVSESGISQAAITQSANKLDGFPSTAMLVEGLEPASVVSCDRVTLNNTPVNAQIIGTGAINSPAVITQCSSPVPTTGGDSGSPLSTTVLGADEYLIVRTSTTADPPAYVKLTFETNASIKATKATFTYSACPKPTSLATPSSDSYPYRHAARM